MSMTKILPELTEISFTEFNTSLILSSSSGSSNECTLTSTSVSSYKPFSIHNVSFTFSSSYFSLYMLCDNDIYIILCLTHCFLDEIATWTLTGVVCLLILIIVLISLLFIAYCIYKRRQGRNDYEPLNDDQCCCWRR